MDKRLHPTAFTHPTPAQPNHPDHNIPSNPTLPHQTHPAARYPCVKPLRANGLSKGLLWSGYVFGVGEPVAQTPTTAPCASHPTLQPHGIHPQHPTPPCPIQFHSTSPMFGAVAQMPNTLKNKKSKRTKQGCGNAVYAQNQNT